MVVRFTAFTQSGSAQEVVIKLKIVLASGGLAMIMASTTNVAHADPAKGFRQVKRLMCGESSR